MISILEANGYEYILGARLKNESGRIKTEILQHTFIHGDIASIAKTESARLIVNHFKTKASKDEYNRKRGLTRLEKQVRAGKLTKSNINNRGYNKYLKLTGEISIEIDYQKYNQDKAWDGLKGCVTNTRLSDAEVMENYKNLLQIEKAFRMSKTDLRIRPIYHRLRDRIEAHICIAFTVYGIYKELERVLYKEKSTLSLKKAAELTHNMYQITYTLSDSRKTKTSLLTMDENQKELFNIISGNFKGVATLKTKELTFLKEIENYILENCLATEVSVFDLAAKLGYSRTTLYRKIKMLTGRQSTVLCVR